MPEPADGHEFVDDVAIADVAFRAWGPSLEAVFRSAGRAVIAVMVDDPHSVRAAERRSVALQGHDVELLLLDYLQELVFRKDAEQLFLLPDALEIVEAGRAYRLTGELVGERIDPARHPINADVKAITLHRFRLYRDGGLWYAEVVVDV